MFTAGSRRRASGALALCVLLGLGLAACRPDPGPGARDRVVWDHNAARAFAGVPGLAVDDSATWNAQQAADRIRDESGDRGCVLNHTSAAQLERTYAGLTRGENLGCFPGCGPAAASATPAFVKSVQHRSNILNPSFRRFGVGVSCNERYLFVAVQFSD